MRAKTREIIAVAFGFILGGACMTALYKSTGRGQGNLSALAEIAADEEMSKYDYKIKDSDDGISYEGMSAVLKDATTLNVFFRLTERHTIEEYSDFMIDGVKTEAEERGNLYCVSIKGISAKALGNPHVITVGGVTISNISVMSYVRRVSQKETVGTAEGELVESLYRYYKAAEGYFCDEHEYETEVVSETTGYRVGVEKQKCKNCGGERYMPLNYTYGIEFTLNEAGTEYAVTGYEGKEETIFVPETYNGIAVTEIASYALESETIKNVVLAKSIRKIEAESFGGNTIYYEGENWADVTVSMGSGIAMAYSYRENAPTDQGNYWRYKNGEIYVYPPVKVKTEVKLVVPGGGGSKGFEYSPAYSGKYSVEYTVTGNIDDASIDDVSVAYYPDGKTYVLIEGLIELKEDVKYKFLIENGNAFDVTVTLTIVQIE